jgi:hypothetical protein
VQQVIEHKRAKMMDEHMTNGVDHQHVDIDEDLHSRQASDICSFLTYTAFSFRCSRPLLNFVN